MADTIEVKSKSTEEIAYKLFYDVIGAEDHPHQRMQPKDARAYILDTFVECLSAARGYRPK